MVRRVSSLYETAPVGPEQPMFYNAACEFETDLPPRDLLRLVQEVEREMGRPEDDERWGPRLIDIDILLYDERVVEEEGLVVPHPEMRKRAFVLVPLADGEYYHPFFDRIMRFEGEGSRAERIVGRSAIPNVEATAVFTRVEK